MFHFGDFPSEALQHRLHHWIAFKLSAQFLRGRSRARPRGGRRCNCFEFSTDSHRATEDLARSDTDLLERVAAFEHLGERALVRCKINSQFSTIELPSDAVLDQFAEKFLLGLDRLLDLRNLLIRDAADKGHSQFWLCSRCFALDIRFWLRVLKPRCTGVWHGLRKVAGRNPWCRKRCGYRSRHFAPCWRRKRSGRSGCRSRTPSACAAQRHAVTDLGQQFFQ